MFEEEGINVIGEDIVVIDSIQNGWLKFNN